MLILLLSLLMVDPINLETVSTLQPPPDDSDLFIELPVDVAFDDKGGIYVLDVAAKKVFIWDSSGNYRSAFGQEGPAPGEFAFSRRRGPGTGFLSILGNELYVFDGGKREVNIYSLPDLTFRKAIPFKQARGRTEGFWAIAKQRYLIHKRTFGESGLREVVQIMDEEGALLQTLADNKTNDVRIQGGSGQGRRSMTFIGYAPKTSVNYDASQERVVVGYSDFSSLTEYNTSGKETGSVKFKIPRLEVTKEDKEEYGSQERFANSNRFKVEYPSEKAFYDAILPAGKKGYLVYNISPVKRDLQGFLIGREGTVLARFNYHCGENGSLVGERGRMLAVRTDENGEFKLHEVKVN